MNFMTAEELLIDEFEAGQVAPESFHHAEHVRLTFAYLSKYSALEALSKFSTALKRFAAAQGKAERYNETITFAYFFLINERMARRKFADWNEFARNNPDLLVWNDRLLSQYYKQFTLKSDLARSVFILPDRF